MNEEEYKDIFIPCKNYFLLYKQNDGQMWSQEVLCFVNEYDERYKGNYGEIKAVTVGVNTMEYQEWEEWGNEIKHEGDLINLPYPQKGERTKVYLFKKTKHGYYNPACVVDYEKILKNTGLKYPPVK